MDICSNCTGPRKAKFANGLCEKCYDRKIIEKAGTHLCACGCNKPVNNEKYDISEIFILV